MPIEFHCPGCGKLMRTPDDTAGRKGKCPSCGLKVRIPDASLVPTLEPLDASDDGLSENLAVASPLASDSIHFACTNCSKPLSAPAAQAGRKGQCPGCGTIFRIPQASDIPQSVAAMSHSTGNTKWRTETAIPAGSVQFHCPDCGLLVTAPASSSGKQGQCPQCQSVFTIPAFAMRPQQRPM